MNKVEVRDIVLGILLDDVLARNSDRYLFIKVLEKTSPDALNKSAKAFLLDMDLPKIETVSRARRWAQEHYPVTKPNVAVEEIRGLEETEYKDLFNNRQAYRVAIKMPELAQRGVKR